MQKSFVWKFCLSRHYLHGFDLNEIREIQLHGFSDTSFKAHVAVIYLRFILIDGSTFTSLVSSKTKVIPIKKQKLSAPRLELLACSLLTKLLKNALYLLNFVYSDIKLYCWTDSTDCVFWINSYNEVRENFVQKQVMQIRSNLPNTKWLHCPGTANPADIPSSELSLNWKSIFNMWINGSQFLYYSDSEWRKLTSYNNTREKPANLRSKENDVSCLTNVHVKSVRNLKESFNLKRCNNFDKTRFAKRRLIRRDIYVLVAWKTKKFNIRKFYG